MSVEKIPETVINPSTILPDVASPFQQVGAPKRVECVQWVFSNSFINLRKGTPNEIINYQLLRSLIPVLYSNVLSFLVLLLSHHNLKAVLSCR